QSQPWRNCGRDAVGTAPVVAKRKPIDAKVWRAETPLCAGRGFTQRHGRPSVDRPEQRRCATEHSVLSQQVELARCRKRERAHGAVMTCAAGPSPVVRASCTPEIAERACATAAASSG